jgi:glycolate oxidase FAD binding subunit
MSFEVQPASGEELAKTLRQAGERKQAIELGGAFSKRRMGGEITPPDIVISTRRLNRVLLYEPKDLTISVEAGLPYRDLQATLAAQGQMLPLDPPFAAAATIGGVVATNGSGPRRRRYGTARDMIIGLTMMTVGGQTVQSGGMVVKNVTGLDMAKLLVGSFGTLAAIASINFKVFPAPEQQRTFVASAPALDRLLALRAAILKSPLQPAAIDLLNPEAAEALGAPLARNYLLLLEVVSSHATVKRCKSGYSQMASEHKISDFTALEGSGSDRLWDAVREFSARAGSAPPSTCLLRASTPPAQVGEIFRQAMNGTPLPVVARAGAGVGYIACPNHEIAASCLSRMRQEGLHVVVESSPPEAKNQLDLWQQPGPEFAVMQRIKQAFDPDHLLNRGRLFSRI